jgi:hypothetical protein
VVFNKITRHSPEPIEDLRFLALPDSYRGYVGQYAYLAYSPAQNMAWSKDFYRQVGYSRVLQFYLRHPSRTVEMMHSDLRQWTVQMRSIGNFCVGDGYPPRSMSNHFASWSRFRTRLFGVWPEHIVLWYIIFASGAVISVATATDLSRRRVSVVALGIAVLGVCEFGVATLADAAETNRHLVLFHAVTDITIYFAFAMVLIGIAKAISRDHIKFRNSSSPTRQGLPTLLR